MAAKERYPGWEYQPLFNHMEETYGLVLSHDDMYQILTACTEVMDNIQQSLLDNSTPTQYCTVEYCDGRRMTAKVSAQNLRRPVEILVDGNWIDFNEFEDNEKYQVRSCHGCHRATSCYVCEDYNTT